MNHLRKFYKSVNLIKHQNKFSIALDNRQIKTKEKNPILSNSVELANLIKMEFLIQGEYILLPTMPMVS